MERFVSFFPIVLIRTSTRMKAVPNLSFHCTTYNVPATSLSPFDQLTWNLLSGCNIPCSLHIVSCQFPWWNSYAHRHLMHFENHITERNCHTSTAAHRRRRPVKKEDFTEAPPMALHMQTLKFLKTTLENAHERHVPKIPACKVDKEVEIRPCKCLR